MNLGFTDLFAQKAADAGIVVVGTSGGYYTPTYAPLPTYAYTPQGESLGWTGQYSSDPAQSAIIRGDGSSWGWLAIAALAVFALGGS